MLSRREFVKLGAAMGAGALLPLGMAEKVLGFTLAGQALPANPGLLTKFLDPLPTSVPVFSTPASGPYEVGAYQFTAQVHSQIAPTTVWSYRPQGWTQPTDAQGVAIPETTYIGHAFVVRKGTPIQVRWHNNLTVPHPLPVDPSLHMAQPDPNFVPPATFPVDPVTGQSTYNYTLQDVPIVTHVHGGEVASASDGGPDAWWTANGATGPAYPSAGDPADHTLYTYPNGQPPASIWYHDHALGITRLNVYMGLAGPYLMTDPGNEPALPSGTDGNGQPLDIPLVIQDRMFDTTGQLYFPALSLNPTINPFWVPEFFGDHILVNGKVWPYLTVERRAYRFRIYNGSSARAYVLDLVNQQKSGASPRFQQVATDGGYLAAPVPLNKITLLPGERMEIVIDFSAVPAGTNLLLRNSGKTPLPAGAPAKGATTAQVMQFRVRGATATAFTMPAVLNSSLATYPTIPVVAATTKVRSLTLNEWMGMNTLQPLMATLNNSKWPHMGHNLETEDPALGAVEIWEIINTTADAHPIHTHLTQFQLISRQSYNSANFWKAYVTAFGGVDPNMSMMQPMGPPADYNTFAPNPMYAGATGITPYSRTLQLKPKAVPITITNVVGGNPDVAPFLQNSPIFAPPEESGWKDTVQMYPGQVTRILVRFAPIDGSAAYPFDATTGPGYVWHCHILDHEDNEMMRPYHVK